LPLPEYPETSTSSGVPPAMTWSSWRARTELACSPVHLIHPVKKSREQDGRASVLGSSVRPN
jgi:hypothetical protein